MKRNDDLVAIYEDTKSKFDSCDTTDSETEVWSIHRTPMGKEDENLIRVIGTDSVSCLIEHKKKNPNSRVCLLNMASYKRPGGGVENGAKAQEESLFRCSNLGDLIDPSLYPLKPGQYVYTTNVTFFKDFYYNDVTPVVCDVVTVPAINLNKKSYYDPVIQDYVDVIEGKPKGYREYLEALMIAFIRAAYCQGVDTLILGAWGCGVFKNKPKDIANSFHNVLERMGHRLLFESVIFPVINDKNSRGDNYAVFKAILDNDD